MKLLTKAGFATAAVTSVLAASASPAAAIVGGNDANQLPDGIMHLTVDYPSIGATLSCGAALFPDPWHVVTAAHCLSDQLVAPTVAAVEPQRVHVRAGSLDRTTGGQTANGTQVTLQENWAWVDPTTGKSVSDLAQLALDRPLPGPVLKVPALPSKPGGKLQLVGWGLTTYPEDPADPDPLPHRLQQRDGSQLQNRYCTTEVGVFTTGDVCLSKGECFGDSGTPILKLSPDGTRAVGIAVLSRETDSAAPCNSPTIGTSLPYFRDWLLATAACTPKGRPATSGACAPRRDVTTAKRVNGDWRKPWAGSLLQPTRK
jgi:secreted trypsin-like serine protease